MLFSKSSTTISLFLKLWASSSVQTSSERETDCRLLRVTWSHLAVLFRGLRRWWRYFGGRREEKGKNADNKGRPFLPPPPPSANRVTNYIHSPYAVFALQLPILYIKRTDLPLSLLFFTDPSDAMKAATVLPLRSYLRMGFPYQPSILLIGRWRVVTRLTQLV